MLSTTLNQLGYNMLARTPSKSDVICISCQQRISQDAAHCYCCGAKQHVEAIAEKEQSLAKDDEQAISIQKALEPTITKPTSTAELEHAIMDEYSLAYENDYVHKNVWAHPYRGQTSLCMV